MVPLHLVERRLCHLHRVTERLVRSSTLSEAGKRRALDQLATLSAVPPEWVVEHHPPPPLEVEDIFEVSSSP